VNGSLLVPMRLTAAVAHALPGVRLRLRDGARTLLEVVRTDAPADGVVTPCAFRAAVARAHRLLEAGERLRFLGLAEGEAPAIDVAVGPGGAIHPGGLYVVPRADGHLHAFATTLEPAACRTVVGAEASIHHDAATDVTIVHRAAPTTEVPPALLDALLRCADEELGRELDGPPGVRTVARNRRLC
jgi:hypothetical protein